MSEPRTALVTGASSGIGRAIAADLLAGGWLVTALARDPARGRLDGARELQADLSDPAAAAASVRAHAEAVGRLDLLVASAAALLPEPLEAVGDASWQRQFDLNVRAAFELVRAAAPLLEASRGLVVAVGSLAALGPLPGAPVYTATKHALLGLMRGLELELAPRGIRITTLLPGYVDTPMATTSGLDPVTMVPVEDVVAALRFLLALTPRTVVPELVLDRAADRGPGPT